MPHDEPPQMWALSRELQSESQSAADLEQMGRFFLPAWGLAVWCLATAGVVAAIVGALALTAPL